MDIFALSLVLGCLFCLSVCGLILAEGWRANRHFQQWENQRD